MKCCICGKKCEDQWGNNPWPVDEKDDARCCNACNEAFVIPARIAQMFKKENK